MFKACLVGAMFLDPFSSGLFSLPFTRVAATASETAAAPHPLQAAPVAAAPRPLLAAPVAQAADATPPAANGQAAAPAQQNTLSRDALQRRQEELARKEQDLKTLEKDLDDRLLRLQELEARLKSMLKEADATQTAKFRHLVDVLSNMKAKQAAGVLETLDEKIAVRVLSGMRGRQAGEILSFVNPAKAARLSESLARVQLPFE